LGDSKTKGKGSLEALKKEAGFSGIFLSGGQSGCPGCSLPDSACRAPMGLSIIQDCSIKNSPVSLCTGKGKIIPTPANW